MTCVPVLVHGLCLMLFSGCKTTKIYLVQKERGIDFERFHCFPVIVSGSVNCAECNFLNGIVNWLIGLEIDPNEEEEQVSEEEIRMMVDVGSERKCDAV